MSLSTEQIQKLGDLNFLARTKLSLQPGELIRLLALAGALKAGTYREWQDGDRSVILGLMAATPDGQWNKEHEGDVVGLLAAEIGVTVANVTRPGVSVVPAQPPPPPPVVVQPSPVPVPSSTGPDFTNAVIAALASLNINVARNYLAVGMPIEFDTSLGLQVGGEAGAGVLGRSNTRGTDGQNPGEVHTNGVVICDNDSGWRVWKGGFWGRKGLVRNTLNRPMTIVAIDSWGDICVSQDPVGSTATNRTYGQHFYMVFDYAAKVIKLAAFQVGWKLKLLETPTTYGDPSKDVLQ